MNVKIILPASQIPENSIVRKVGPNTKCYILKKEIKIFGIDQQPVKHSNMVFLCLDGNISACSDTTEFIWETDFDSLKSAFFREDY